MSIESLCSDDVELPTDDAVVSMDILRSEDVELPDVSVEGSDVIDSWRETESLSPSSVEPIWRNSGCWLQTARNVSLNICMSQSAVNPEKRATNAWAKAKKLCSIALCSLMRSWIFLRLDLCCTHFMRRTGETSDFDTCISCDSRSLIVANASLRALLITFPDMLCLVWRLRNTRSKPLRASSKIETSLKSSRSSFSACLKL